MQSVDNRRLYCFREAQRRLQRYHQSDAVVARRKAGQWMMPLVDYAGSLFEKSLVSSDHQIMTRLHRLPSFVFHCESTLEIRYPKGPMTRTRLSAIVSCHIRKWPADWSDPRFGSRSVSTSMTLCLGMVLW